MFPPDSLIIFADVEVPVACAILIVLFALQHYGTHRVGFLFAPVVLTWLFCISGIGIPPCNCMYNLDNEGKYTVHFLHGRKPMLLPIKGANCGSYASLSNAFWYFPHLSLSVVSL